MVITILGYTGFIGKELTRFLGKKHKISKLNIRQIDLTLNDNEIINILKKKISKSQLVINCCASLKPNTSKDFIVNSKLPKLIQSSIYDSKKKIYFIHLSTLNILLKERTDRYTASKKKSDISLKKKNTTILRLPLVYSNSIDKKRSGNLKILHKYLDINFLPFYPMIYPGHIYRPILVSDLCIFIDKLIKSKRIRPLYNLIGRRRLSFWDIFINLAKKKKKSVIKINTLFISKFFSIFKYVNCIRNNQFLSQILSIDQSNFSKVNLTKV